MTKPRGQRNHPHHVIDNVCATCGPVDGGRESRCPNWRRERARARMTPAKRRDAGLRHKYGMTLAQYDALLSRQGGVCAICKEPPTRRGLDVDHDHRCCPGMRSCGRCVRGLLCSPCNRAVGYMRDDPNLLRLAASYVEAEARPRAIGDSALDALLTEMLSRPAGQLPRPSHPSPTEVTR